MIVEPCSRLDLLTGEIMMVRELVMHQYVKDFVVVDDWIFFSISVAQAVCFE